MTEKIRLLSTALDDMVEAYRWYESRQRGLGAEFVASLEACLDRIVRHPEMYAFACKEYRRTMLRRFPCNVFL